MNDLPAVVESDVGISVDTAAEAVREGADVILLKKDLNVLEEGIKEGRKAFANVSKYIRITASSNFGNIFSIVVASVFLPFFPMTSVQLLLLNLLYDMLCLVLPWDNVDEEICARPLEWSGRTLGRFMRFFGPISSFFDIITFLTVFVPLIRRSRGKFCSLSRGWTAAIYCSISDRMVFGIDVDTGVDFASAAYPEGSHAAKQTFPSSDGCHDAGNFIFHHPDLYASGNVDWFDRFAAELFWLFGRDCFALSVVCYISKRQIS